eukprot:g10960.t1
MWLVKNTADAQTLARTVNCSGGTFNVEWRGSVVVDTTIHIVGGTVLNITGVGSSAGMSAGGTKRLFTVINASLDMSDLNISSGSAIIGGAIAASGSTLNFSRTAFVGNSVSVYGGALYIKNGSRVRFDGHTTFAGNFAPAGGALYAEDGSEASWAGETTFSNNGDAAVVISSGSSASWAGETIFNEGGSVYVEDNSSASWTGETIFLNNCTVFVEDSSSASWAGETIFNESSVSIVDSSSALWTGEAAFNEGGTVTLLSSSSASWTGETTFNEGPEVLLSGDSSASWTGETTFNESGRVYVKGSSSTSWAGETTFRGLVSVDSSSSASWTGKTTFHESVTVVEGSSSASWAGETIFSNSDAGATVNVFDSSSASWAGETTFVNNVATAGATVCVTDRSIASWAGETIFLNNEGSAVYVETSSASWTGNTTFSDNTSPDNGGALSVRSGSNVSWSAVTLFSNNTSYGGTGGGALSVSSGSSVSWSAATLFSNNTSYGSGGAVFVGANSSVEWTGDTTFEFNSASAAGGAVGIAPTGNADDAESSLVIVGATKFINNTAGTNGGGLSLLGALSATFATTANLTFSGNSAGVFGGGVYVLGAGVGPVFTDVLFHANRAGLGGGVYASGSGNVVLQAEDESGEDIQVEYPTNFNGCSFVGNVAVGTGGAVDSGSGVDMFINTLFEHNSAAQGGALRLAGSASVQNCTFLENVSDGRGGAAVLNIGHLSVSNSSFRDNAFNCEIEEFLDFAGEGKEFLDFIKAGDIFGAVCKGCDDNCTSCSYGGRGVPRCVSLSEANIMNVESNGGTTTVQKLRIEGGYWRASNISTKVLACYNKEACKGGVSGHSGYCSKGYEGPYCSVCKEGFMAGLGFRCTECPGKEPRIVIAVALATVGVGAVVVAVLYLVSGEVGGEGIVDRVVRHVPLNSLKILIVLWQILTQFASVANVVYPSVYQSFLEAVDHLNFDLSLALSPACMFRFDFHDRLLLVTIGPLIAGGFLGVTYAIASRKSSSGSKEALQRVRQKHMSAALLVTFFVYSNVSSVVFQTFACEELDDGRDYLRADYRIECDSHEHRRAMVYASFMVFLYPLGIPTLYATLLFRNRNVLNDETVRDQTVRRGEVSFVKSISDLWKPYKPTRFYYEVIECARRIMLTGVLVFVFPDSAPQIAVSLLLAFGFAILLEVLSPYESVWDRWLSLLGHVITFLSMFLAFALKLDVYDERPVSQRTFEVVLVAAHACMVLAMVVEGFVMWKVGHQVQREIYVAG